MNQCYQNQGIDQTGRPQNWELEKNGPKNWSTKKIHKYSNFEKKRKKYIFMCAHMNPNHYTQICKVPHIYSKGMHITKITEYNPYLNKNALTKKL